MSSSSSSSSSSYYYYYYYYYYYHHHHHHYQHYDFCGFVELDIRHSSVHVAQEPSSNGLKKISVRKHNSFAPDSVNIPQTTDKVIREMIYNFQCCV